jgi:hypothetical protein
LQFPQFDAGNVAITRVPVRHHGWYWRTPGPRFDFDANTPGIATISQFVVVLSRVCPRCIESVADEKVAALPIGGTTNLSQYEMLPERVAGRSFARISRFALLFLIAAFSVLGTFGVAHAAETPESVPDIGADDYEFDSNEIDFPESGQFIVDYAMQYLGYSYASGGNGPGGFDCSGFTQYVILNTLGVDIGHDVAGQINSGYWVDWGNWQAGDLVFFAGTYRAGISHVGIYIGDGQFIHSENYGTGVTISSVWSDYYSGHYYGALRLV